MKTVQTYLPQPSNPWPNVNGTSAATLQEKSQEVAGSSKPTLPLDKETPSPFFQKVAPITKKMVNFI